jgi:hypothetical protein
MNSKRVLPLLLITISTLLTAQVSSTLKFSGFVRNDFFYNSRQNLEGIDGTFQYFPKPIENDPITGIDKNNVPQSEMLSIASRLILDVIGAPIFGAKSYAKIEADFAGFGTNNYVLRIRQAFTKLNWDQTELLVGQTWHPLFGTVVPTTPSLNAGSPFQPFNRSPQIRLKYDLSKEFSITAAGIYQMQYLSYGPLGASNTYLKNAILPDFFLGTEYKTANWTSGIGADVKTIKPSVEKITSLSAVAYTQYVHLKFQFKAKAFWGENMSDLQMPWGYGVTDSINGNTGYTNFKMMSSWINAVYGAKWQVGALVGYSQNLGTNKKLLDVGGKLTAYGTGFSASNQLMVDRLFRIAPHVSYNLSNIKLGAEFDVTTAEYGKLQTNGRIINPTMVNNKRVVVSLSYLF